MTRYYKITSAGLKDARKAKHLNQTELGKRAGFDRGAVSYWENRQDHLWSSPALDSMLDVLGLGHLKYYPTPNAHARTWGFTDVEQERINEQAKHKLQRLETREQQRLARLRVPCLAKTRKGHPCRLMSEAGRKRCIFHGGMSTGPRTKDGKAKIAEAQRLRWRRYRMARVSGL